MQETYYKTIGDFKNVINIKLNLRIYKTHKLNIDTGSTYLHKYKSLWAKFLNL